MLLAQLTKLMEQFPRGAYGAVDLPGGQATLIAPANASRKGLLLAYVSGATFYVMPDALASPRGIPFTGTTAPLQLDVEVFGGAVQGQWYGFPVAAPAVAFWLESQFILEPG